MSYTSISPQISSSLLQLQRDEISSYHTYLRLAEISNDSINSATLSKIAHQEKFHYQTWKNYTNKEVTYPLLEAERP
jgi:rubrerythrin